MSFLAGWLCGRLTFWLPTGLILSLEMQPYFYCSVQRAACRVQPLELRLESVRGSSCRPPPAPPPWGTKRMRIAPAQEYAAVNFGSRPTSHKPPPPGQVSPASPASPPPAAKPQRAAAEIKLTRHRKLVSLFESLSKSLNE